MKRSALAVMVLLSAGTARAAPAEEVEVTAGVVTGLKCALDARARGELRKLSSCPPAEGQKELVVFDVAERRIYRISEKKVARHELESAFGGGSIDFSGKTVKLDAATGIATVDVSEFSVTKKPKAGAFKGCL